MSGALPPGDPSAGDRVVVAAQDAAHLDDHDYRHGSPHLTHPTLRTLVETELTAAVKAAGGARVLEIGAGHGTFTDTLLRAGARVTVTETSQASAAHLRRRFDGDERVEVAWDATGRDLLPGSRQWDLVVMISVLHHIPDYVGYVRELLPHVATGGGFFSAQDPLWYPRLPRVTRAASRASYLTWRVFQGDLRAGAATLARRAQRGVTDEPAADLVEYHVVRSGVDEVALTHLLDEHFDRVRMTPYWSTQSALLQRLGQRTPWRSEFLLGATGRR